MLTSLGVAGEGNKRDDCCRYGRLPLCGSGVNRICLLVAHARESCKRGRTDLKIVIKISPKEMRSKRRGVTLLVLEPPILLPPLEWCPISTPRMRWARDRMYSPWIGFAILVLLWSSKYER